MPRPLQALKRPYAFLATASVATAILSKHIRKLHAAAATELAATKRICARGPEEASACTIGTHAAGIDSCVEQAYQASKLNAAAATELAPGGMHQHAQKFLHESTTWNVGVV